MDGRDDGGSQAVVVVKVRFCLWLLAGSPSTNVSASLIANQFGEGCIRCRSDY